MRADGVYIGRNGAWIGVGALGLGAGGSDGFGAWALGGWVSGAVW